MSFPTIHRGDKVIFENGCIQSASVMHFDTPATAGSLSDLRNLLCYRNHNNRSRWFEISHPDKSEIRNDISEFFNNLLSNNYKSY